MRRHPDNSPSAAIIVQGLQNPGPRTAIFRKQRQRQFVLSFWERVNCRTPVLLFALEQLAMAVTGATRHDRQIDFASLYQRLQIV